QRCTCEDQGACERKKPERGVRGLCPSIPVAGDPRRTWKELPDGGTGYGRGAPWSAGKGGIRRRREALPRSVSERGSERPTQGDRSAETGTNDWRAVDADRRSHFGEGGFRRGRKAFKGNPGSRSRPLIG